MGFPFQPHMVRGQEASRSQTLSWHTSASHSSPPSQHIQRDELVANQLFVNSGFLVTALFRSENRKDAISAPDQPQDHPPLQTT